MARICESWELASCPKSVRLPFSSTICGSQPAFHRFSAVRNGKSNEAEAVGQKNLKNSLFTTFINTNRLLYELDGSCKCFISGKMYPSVLSLYMAPFTDQKLANPPNEWNTPEKTNFHGVNLTVLQNFATADNFKHMNTVLTPIAHESSWLLMSWCLFPDSIFCRNQ